eukprot:CAMPEP_0181321420 /NCGR_PEP_ID=MMETSP1101-20121128/18672_1 /TAXON_ID=46948 /ORGANISM="Rhodomonas abbreviata, Strain Caron Lab Isolate" /LENGTH=91 /DNA_ID=CAMNT_0023429239 /DNA_START=813 /DNA_END=1088 /DNA_ORIENTATION=+
MDGPGTGSSRDVPSAVTAVLLLDLDLDTLHDSTGSGSRGSRLAFSLGQLGLKLTDALSILAGGVVAFLPVLVGGCSSSCGVCSFGWGCALP